MGAWLEGSQVGGFTIHSVTFCKHKLSIFEGFETGHMRIFSGDDSQCHILYINYLSVIFVSKSVCVCFLLICDQFITVHQSSAVG